MVIVERKYGKLHTKNMARCIYTQSDYAETDSLALSTQLKAQALSQTPHNHHTTQEMVSAEQQCSLLHTESKGQAPPTLVAAPKS